MQFDSIETLQQAISHWLNRLSPAQVRSLTQWGWLIDALCVAGFEELVLQPQERPIGIEFAFANPHHWLAVLVSKQTQDGGYTRLI